MEKNRRIIWTILNKIAGFLPSLLKNPPTSFMGFGWTGTATSLTNWGLIMRLEMLLHNKEREANIFV
jgi:hypothetical protein